jgi:hypothetical protein
MYRSVEVSKVSKLSCHVVFQMSRRLETVLSLESLSCLVVSPSRLAGKQQLHPGLLSAGENGQALNAILPQWLEHHSGGLPSDISTDFRRSCFSFSHLNPTSCGGVQHHFPKRTLKNSCMCDKGRRGSTYATNPDLMEVAASASTSKLLLWRL